MTGPAIRTDVIPAAQALARAASILDAGGIVAVPTETVYGLAGDAANGDAVAAIYAAKARPSFNPLILHVDGLAMARRLAGFPPLADTLADAFWPGPLTMVLPLRPGAPVHPLALAGLRTVALRWPRGTMAELVTLLGRPLVAPSANPSGRISATTAQDVAGGLDGRIPLVLDGGPCSVGVESTIVAVDNDRITLLRAGGIPVDLIEAAAGRSVETPVEAAITAPGMLASHYAPRQTMRLDVTDIRAGEALLTFGKPGFDCSAAAAIEDLSPAGDLAEAATNLFAALHRLERSAADVIAVMPVPDHGLGLAINDRLRRAAAPRPDHGDGDA